MEETKHQFPTEEVTLPSKGLLYPKESPLSKGVVEIKYMTAKEEDILTNQNYIQKGTVIDKLLKSLIVTPIDYNDLLTGDKNAILIAARILGYGKDYDFKYQDEDASVDLSELEDKELDESLIVEGKNEFDFTLPFSKKSITFKLLTQADDTKIQNELKGLKKINKNSNPENTTRLKHTILSVEGDTTPKTIREFVDNSLLARDARELRKYITHVSPDVDLNVSLTLRDGEVIEDITLPIGVNFFWPDVEL
jgi:hypothetical protein|tara:strand:- start:719 stop:1471 length:753 start_codon:yes stop_codon:yes gene_type:complete